MILEGSRALGVRAISDGSPVEFYGSEIVLSAGSTFTPPILVRSGIGPADDLKALGLDVVADLPVGKNLSDHATVAVIIQLNELARCQQWTQRNNNCAIRYTSGVTDTGENDMILLSMNLGGYHQDGLQTGIISTILWESFSRGALTVTDTDPFAMPQIQENLLTDERDRIRLRDGARHVFELAQSRAFRSIATDVVLRDAARDATDLRIEDLRTDRDLDEWISQSVTDTWHLVGTCRMGNPDDPRAVVDPECRVLGVENLRVIDGSIMPNVTRANTNLPCMTIAEHMAAQMG